MTQAQGRVCIYYIVCLGVCMYEVARITVVKV
jgi:hypothetical protein